MWQGGHTAGVQFPKGAPQSRRSMECSLVSVGGDESCIISSWSLLGETSFLTAGLLRAFKVYLMNPQEGDILFRLIFLRMLSGTSWRSNVP